MHDIATFYTQLGLLDGLLTTAHRDWYASHWRDGGDNVWLEQRWIAESGGAVACVDPEGVNVQSRFYVKLLATLARISRGAFDASGANETWELPFVRVDFGGHSLRLERRGDFASTDLIVEINLGLRERQFELSGSPSEWVIVCVNETEKAALQRRGWRFWTPTDFTGR